MKNLPEEPRTIEERAASATNQGKTAYVAPLLVPIGNVTDLLLGDAGSLDDGLGGFTAQGG